MRNYYIYYRVDPTKADAAAEAARSMLRALAGAFRIPARLRHRCDDPHLWMEVYESVTDAARFEAALEDAERASGIGACLMAGERRHRECFLTMEGDETP